MKKQSSCICNLFSKGNYSKLSYDQGSQSFVFTIEKEAIKLMLLQQGEIQKFINTCGVGTSNRNKQKKNFYKNYANWLHCSYFSFRL